MRRGFFDTRKPRTFPCRAIDAHPAVKFLQKPACGLRGLRGVLGWCWRARRSCKNPAALCASPCRAMTPCVRLLPCRGTALWREPADLHRTGLCLIRCDAHIEAARRVSRTDTLETAYSDPRLSAKSLILILPWSGYNVYVCNIHIGCKTGHSIGNSSQICARC